MRIASSAQRTFEHTSLECSGKHSGIREPDADRFVTILSQIANRGPRKRPSPPPITTIEECSTNDHHEEDELNLMQLSRFAYQRSSSQPNPKHRDASFSTTKPNCSRSKSQAEPTQVSKLRCGPSDAQLSNIFKCVCCGLQWTTKKTVRQKKVHMEQCAKKQGIAGDTLLLLVNKETSTPSLQTTSPSMENGAQVPGENATLMCDIVATEAGKKSRQKQVISTVRSLPETRKSILGRAKDILGQTGTPNVCDDRLCTIVDDIQPTQQFGTSALARRNTGTLSYSKETPPIAYVEPGSTQPFSESTVCRRRTSRMFDAYLEASSGSCQGQYTTTVCHSRLHLLDADLHSVQATTLFVIRRRKKREGPSGARDMIQLPRFREPKHVK